MMERWDKGKNTRQKPHFIGHLDYLLQNLKPKIPHLAHLKPDLDLYIQHQNSQCQAIFCTCLLPSHFGPQDPADSQALTRQHRLWYPLH